MYRDIRRVSEREIVKIRRYHRAIEKEKGVWWMPRLSEAKKDVTSCEKPRGGANDPRSVDV